MSMASDEFACFILTHGRARKQLTLKTLIRQGYTGSVYLIVDNEDESLDEYRRLYGEKVIVFDKRAVWKTFDQADNFVDLRTPVYARNACFQIAAELGLDYFLQLDDDYSRFGYKFDAEFMYVDKTVLNLDRLFATVLAFYKSIPALTVALSQTGDFIGGCKGRYARTVMLKRKAMNSFFCSVKRPFKFIGRVNEDVNTYVALGNRGDLFLTIFQATLWQMRTQLNPGGFTDVYLNEGTYWKSFYPVMYAPSCVKVSALRQRHGRIHHKIAWANAVPCIVSEEYRKSGA